jgi:ssDNA-binding Zn-finger/Zn-ribbon topoisomerase 1
MRVKTSTEILTHFNCPKCKKWWAIGDFPKDRKKVYCPWCGKELKL